MAMVKKRGGRGVRMVLLGTFRLDYEYTGEIEYEYDFPISNQ